MKKLLIIVGLFLGNAAFSENSVGKQHWSLLKLDYMGLEYRDIRNYRDAYFPEFTTIEKECKGEYADGTPSNECWKYGATVKFDLSLLRVNDYFNVYWRNGVGMDATTKQVRRVGWNWEAGIDLGRVEVGTEHFSSHYLDGKSEEKFKLYDVYKITFDIYGKKNND